jgi:hypothetical protein
MAKIISGAALVAGAIALDVFTAGLATPLTGLALTFVSTGIASALTLGASLVIGGIAQALSHNLGFGIATKQAAAPRTILYGRTRLGGVLTYPSLTGSSSKFLHLVVVHCSNSVQGVPALYLDGKLVVMGSGNFDDGNQHRDIAGVKYNFKGHVYWEFRSGAPGQASFSALTSEDSNYPSTATLDGHCCSYIRLLYDASIFPTGIPSIKVDLIGKNDIYDPRSGTRGYSENVALCIADVMTNKDYGLQCDYATEIDEAQLIAAANICDEQVGIAAGGSEARYSCNGAFTTDQAPGEIIKQMLTACAGRTTYIDGRWAIYPAAFIPPTVTLDDSCLIAPLKWNWTLKYREKINIVKGSFVCPTFPYVTAGPGLPFGQPILTGQFDGEWQQTDIPAYAQDPLHGYASDANLAADGGTVLWLDTRFPYTISVATAQRLAKILLMRNRQQGNGTLVCNLSAFQCQAMDTIQFSHARFGWSNKLMEITNWRLNFGHDDQSGSMTMSVELDVNETDPSVYAWDPREELTIQDNPPPSLPNMQLVEDPTSLVLESDASTLVLGADGIQRSAIKVTWTAPADGFVTGGGFIQLQSKQTADANFSGISQFDGATIITTISNVNDGINYTVRIRSVSVSGASGNWVAAAITASNANSNFGNSVSTTATAGINGAAPGTVAGYIVTNVGGSNVKVPYFNP